MAIVHTFPYTMPFMDTTIRVSKAVRDLLFARAKASGVSIGEMVERLAQSAPMTDDEIDAHHHRLTRVLGWTEPVQAGPDFAARLADAFDSSADGGTARL